MFRLDIEIFNAIYQHCKLIGEGFGFGVLEGFFINGIAIVGVVLVAINNKTGVKK